MNKPLLALFFGLFTLVMFSCDGAKESDGGEATKKTEEQPKTETKAQPKEESKTVNYNDDYEAFKAALLAGNEEEANKYTTLPEGKSISEMMGWFDEPLTESLKKSKYSSAVDLEEEGKTVKDLSIMAKYGDGEMESAVVFRFEETAEGLRLIDYLMAG